MQRSLPWLLEGDVLNFYTELNLRLVLRVEFHLSGKGGIEAGSSEDD